MSNDEEMSDADYEKLSKTAQFLVERTDAKRHRKKMDTHMQTQTDAMDTVVTKIIGKPMENPAVPGLADEVQDNKKRHDRRDDVEKEVAGNKKWYERTIIGAALTSVVLAIWGWLFKGG